MPKCLQKVKLDLYPPIHTSINCPLIYLSNVIHTKSHTISYYHLICVWPMACNSCTIWGTIWCTTTRTKDHDYLDPLDRGNFHTKAKIDQFCQIKEKKNFWTVISTPERFFNSRTLPNGFERFFNNFLTLFEAFWTPFERFFPLQNVRTFRNGKITTLVFFFPHQPPKSIFFGFGVKKKQYLEWKKNSIWKLQVII